MRGRHGQSLGARLLLPVLELVLTQVDVVGALEARAACRTRGRTVATTTYAVGLFMWWTSVPWEQGAKECPSSPTQIGESLQVAGKASTIAAWPQGLDLL